MQRDQKPRLTRRLDVERRKQSQLHVQTLSNGRVLIMAAINFCSIIGGFGVRFWLPQIVKGFGLSNVQVGFVNTIPYLFAAVAMVLWARSSDRAEDRTWHVALTTLLAAVGLVLNARVNSRRH